MATILHSSLGKTIRCALSLEGNLSTLPFQQRWRLLHAGRTTHLAGATRAKPILKSPKMAAVVRSSLGKTVRHVLSLEGNLSQQHYWRLLHAGRAARLTRPSGPKPFLKSPKVDLLVKKIDDVARRAALVEFTQSLVQEEKTKFVSPNSLGIARLWYLAVCYVGLYTAGYHVGFYRTPKEYQESGSKN